MPRGRPREAVVDVRLLEAVRTLLADTDYADVSIARISGLAGAGRAAIYRRWSSKPELVFAAVVHGTELDARRFDQGGLATDLHALVEHVVALLNTPVARNALPGLVAELQTSPEVRRRFQTRFIRAERDLIADILSRARSRGELQTGQPIGAPEVHAHLLGMVWAELFLVTDSPVAGDVVDRVFRSVLSTLSLPDHRGPARQGPQPGRQPEDPC
ncbi:TetR/AcrR family transcriptional regulator [Frankia sp. Ag45/Mut15]|uniref:TetR/AcrR family transcriptional regulator n=1 Tax=Frankia umida TaxID=573489 RepID=A0ABT0K4K4_9ACTN|nr:TetR/AcrR family transcriptional regulator [Frankia umida]MCK9878705.1 TetR/AcrR family transcriptional regulator [Frankia umida]